MDLRVVSRGRLWAFCLGFLAFSGSEALLVVGVAFYCLLFASQSRLDTFLLATFFGLGGGALILLDVLGYEVSSSQLFVLYLLSAVLQGVVMAALWHPSWDKRVIFCLAGSLLLLVPPFGVAHVTHPFLCFLPAARGQGLLGVIVIISGYFAASAFRPWGAWCATGIVILSGLFIPATPAPGGASGVMTHNPRSEDADEYSRIRRVQWALSDASGRPGELLVYPEFYFGQVTPLLSMIWSSERHDDSAAIIAGGVEANAKGIYNVVLYGAKELRQIYRQRYPIPFAMWHPWDMQESYLGDENSRVVQLGTKRSALFLCYEALVPAAYAEALLGRPEQIIALSSTPWEVNGHTRRLQKMLLERLSEVLRVSVAIGNRT